MRKYCCFWINTDIFLTWKDMLWACPSTCSASEPVLDIMKVQAIFLLLKVHQQHQNSILGLLKPPQLKPIAVPWRDLKGVPFGRCRSPWTKLYNQQPCMECLLRAKCMQGNQEIVKMWTQRSGPPPPKTVSGYLSMHEKPLYLQINKSAFSISVHITRYYICLLCKGIWS